MKQNETKNAQNAQKRTRFFTVNVVTIQRHILECGIDILTPRNTKKLK